MELRRLLNYVQLVMHNHLILNSLVSFAQLGLLCALPVLEKSNGLANLLWYIIVVGITVERMKVHEKGIGLRQSKFHSFQP